MLVLVAYCKHVVCNFESQKGICIEKLQTKMLCLEAWLGKQVGKDSSHIKVFSKLGGNFLGYIRKPEAQDKTQVIRSMQDEISQFFKHIRPSRYLVLFVGQVRITPPSFPWDGLATVSPDALVIRRVDTMYNEDDMYALHRINDFFGLDVMHTPGQLEVTSRSKYPTWRPCTLLLQQLEVFAFRGDQTPITTLVFKNHADSLVGIENFLDVERIRMVLDANVSEVDFRDLAKSRKLVELQVVMGSKLSKDVGLMVNLRKLDVCTRCSYGQVPTEVGVLTKLTSLALRGPFEGAIPTELGHLKDLVDLVVEFTQLRGRIPKELSSLPKLASIVLSGNPNLRGDLPDFEACTFLSLEGSKNIKPHRFFLRGGAWESTAYKKRTWTRQLPHK